MIHYIYKTINNITGEFYIGHHSQREEELDSYLGSSKLLHEDINKFGIENFKKEIIEYCSLEIIKEREKFWIIELEAKKYGYNLKSTGTGGEMIGKKHSKDTLKKLSDASKGVNNPMFDIHRFGEESPMFGKHHSKETKEKLSESRRGKTSSIETRIKISKAISGERNPMYSDHRFAGENNPMYNHVYSLETKKRMSESRKNIQKVTCPHCNKTMNIVNAKQYHFDKCKMIKN